MSFVARWRLIGPRWETAGVRQHAATARGGAGCLGLEVARRSAAGHALRVANAAPQPRVRADGIVTLALGIGVNIGMFSLVNGLLFRPLCRCRRSGGGGLRQCNAAAGEARDFSYPNYRDIQAGTTGIFTNLAAYSMAFAGLDAGAGARQAFAAAVTADYFHVFGAPVADGRFTMEEERPGAGIGVAIISHSLWEQLGATPKPSAASCASTANNSRCRSSAGGIHRASIPAQKSSCLLAHTGLSRAGRRHRWIRAKRTSSI